MPIQRDEFLNVMGDILAPIDWEAEHQKKVAKTQAARDCDPYISFLIKEKIQAWSRALRECNIDQDYLNDVREIALDYAALMRMKRSVLNKEKHWRDGEEMKSGWDAFKVKLEPGSINEIEP